MKNKIAYIFLIGALIVPIFSISQNTLEIELDSIHCQDSICYFLNFSDKDIYNCDFTYNILAEDRFLQTMDCYKERDLKSKLKKKNTLNLNRFKTLIEFKEWSSQIRLVCEYESGNNNIYKHFQLINQNYAIMQRIITDRETQNLIKEDYEVFQVVPIKVNNDYHIGGLINIDDNEIENLLLPDRDLKYLIYSFNDDFRPTSEILEIDPFVYREIFNTYTVRNKNSKYIITNSISSDPLIQGQFDKVTLDYPFVITKLKNKVLIYNKLLEEIKINKLSAAYPGFGYLQLIIDNEIRWLNRQGIISKKIPEVERVIDCGNGPCTEKEIFSSQGSFFEIISNCDFNYFNTSHDTFEFNLGEKISEIKYLNGTIKKYFSNDCFMQLFCHKTNQYYFKTKSGKEGIFERIDENEEEINKVWESHLLSIDQKKAKIDLLRDPSNKSFRDEVIFEGNFDEFKLSNYNQPIIYKQNNLFGIYPQMEKPLYSLILPFVGSLARIVFINDEKGWIDLEGNEIHERKN